MKKIIIIMAALLTLAACTLETSDNGRLNGMWQLTQLDTLATEGCADMRSKGTFWSVDGNLLQIAMLYDLDRGVFFRFYNNGDRQFTISDPYLDNRAEGDIKVTNPEILKKYNIDALEQTFDIEHLSSGKMTLRSERFRFHFRKY